MTKQELVETYTAEQLAGMVINLQSASEVKNDEIHKLKWQISSLEEENGRMQDKLDTYNDYLLPRATKEAREMIDYNHFSGVRIVTWEQWNNREVKDMNISDIQKCQEEYEKLLQESPFQSTIERICRDITDQKNNAMAMEFTKIICDLLKRYGVYVHCTESKLGEKITTNSIEEKYGIVFDSMDLSQHDKEFTDEIEELKQHISDLERDLKTAGEKIQDLVGENMKLQCERNDYKSKSEFLEVERMRVKQNEFSDFLPTEPIKVADILINAMHEPCASVLSFGKPYSMYDMSELRQIAEHLLVYCNHYGEEEE